MAIFLLMNLIFLLTKSEVRRIEVAGGELATQRIKGIGIHFFDPLADHEDLALLHIGALGKPLPVFMLNQIESLCVLKSAWLNLGKLITLPLLSLIR